MSERDRHLFRSEELGLHPTPGGSETSISLLCSLHVFALIVVISALVAEMFVHLYVLTTFAIVQGVSKTKVLLGQPLETGLTFSGVRCIVVLLTTKKCEALGFFVVVTASATPTELAIVTRRKLFDNKANRKFSCASVELYHDIELLTQVCILH